MGSEQSQPATAGSSQGSAANAQRMNQRPVSVDAARLQRGYTIAAPTSDSLNNSQLVDSSPPPLDSRPGSPPMSVCSDSDLPYISYTDKPIGGDFDLIKTIQDTSGLTKCIPYLESPKLRNKGQKVNKSRPAVNLRRQSTSAGATRKLTSSQGTLVVVNRGGTSKDSGIEKDPDIVRLQVIIQCIY
jgi:BLOC-1 related complex subunit 5